MAAFQLRIDLDGADKLTAMQALLSPATFERALKGGMQYAAKATPPAISKAVGARYTWKAADIKDDIRRPRFFDGGRSVSIGLSKRPRSVAVFGGRPKPDGYSYAIFRGQRETFKGGFDGTFNGVRLPYYRTGDAKRTMGKGRYAGTSIKREPVDVIHGPSLGSVFLGNSRFGAVMKDEVEERMRRQFIVGIDRELSRKSRGF
jgi:hypothetical protein